LIAADALEIVGVEGWHCEQEREASEIVHVSTDDVLPAISRRVT
jgi:hypothetical protein